MPNRRRPKRPPEITVAEHSRQAFRGALGGASAVPQPTDRSIKPSALSASSGPKMLFAQDEFVVGQDVFIDPVTGTITLNLTYDPVEFSEHLYWHSSYVEPAPIPTPEPIAWCSGGLRPNLIVPSVVNEPYYTGGAGNSTLRDDIDGTYVSSWHTYPPHSSAQAVAVFEAASIPLNMTITSMTLKIRCRTTDSATYWGWDFGTFTTDPTDYSVCAYKNMYTAPTSSWVDYTFTATVADLGVSNDDAVWDLFPTVAQLNDGKVMVMLDGPTSGLASASVDYAEVCLSVEYEPEAAPPTLLGSWAETSTSTSVEAYYWGSSVYLWEDLNGTDTNSIEPAGGEITIVWATAYGQPITAPAGWTTLGFGTTGANIHWLAAYTTATAGTDWTFTAAGPTEIGVATWFFTGTGTPTVSVAETLAATTRAVSVSAGGPWCAWACSDDSADAIAVHTDNLDPTQTGMSFPYMYRDGLGVGTLVYGFSLPGSAQALGGVLTAYQYGGSHLSTNTADWVMASFGWA